MFIVAIAFSLCFFYGYGWTQGEFRDTKVTNIVISFKLSFLKLNLAKAYAMFATPCGSSSGPCCKTSMAKIFTKGFSWCFKVPHPHAMLLRLREFRSSATTLPVNAFISGSWGRPWWTPLLYCLMWLMSSNDTSILDVLALKVNAYHITYVLQDYFGCDPFWQNNHH